MLKQDLILHSLARHLINDGLLDKNTAADALQHAQMQGIQLISYLVKNNLVTSLRIAKSCEKIFGLPFIDLAEYDLLSIDTSVLNSHLIQQYRVIPLHKHNHLLQIGISDPTNQQALDAITFHTGLNITPVIVQEDQLSHFIETHFNQINQVEMNKNLQRNLIKQITADDLNHTIQDNVIIHDEPLIKFVDNIIQHAYQQKASDIHIEPYETICRVRFRLHGVLHPVNEVPLLLASRIVTRLKVMAKLDISEKRLPQDGRFQLGILDIRINTCPTLFGEKVVLRLLNSSNMSLEMNRLGMSVEQKNILLKMISQPQGMVLVTGPTGSGKTITLYSALHFLNQAEKNISTVEDPIEIRLPGINQVNVNPKIGLDFSAVLRTFLRQDPDIMMIGEIRDTETANIAIQAAQTGHLVLSTLHTNSAIETITRLRAMDILPYNIASSISLIIAQRLIRVLCDQCKEPEALPPSFTLPSHMKQPQSDHVYRAVGCSQCHRGYSTRTAIYEFLPFTEALTQLITSGSDIHALSSLTKQTGFISLKESMFEKVFQGITSLAEVNRVLQL